MDSPFYRAKAGSTTGRLRANPPRSLIRWMPHSRSRSRSLRSVCLSPPVRSVRSPSIARHPATSPVPGQPAHRRPNKGALNEEVGIRVGGPTARICDYSVRGRGMSGRNVLPAKGRLPRRRPVGLPCLLLLPWHLYDPLPSGLNVTLPAGTVELDGRPGATGSPWRDLIGVYAPLAEWLETTQGRRSSSAATAWRRWRSWPESSAVVSGRPRLVRRSRGLSHRGFDDFGLLGRPAAGQGGRLRDLTLPDALGLASLGEASVTLVNGRDLDRAEAEALAGSKVTHVSVAELDADRLPEGPKVLPIDVDIIDPAQLGRLRFPAPGGPSLQDVVDAVRAVVHDRPLAALDIAVTWRPQDTTRAQTDAVLSALLWSIQPHP